MVHILKSKFLPFLVKEIFLVSSFFAFLISVILTKKIDFNINDFEPIFILFFLFIAIKGLEDSLLLLYIAKNIESQRFVAFKLVIIAFVFSALFNIDVAIVALLPLILMMNLKNKELLVILVAFTTHLGGALLPFSTPQNLFIFSFYNIKLFDFIKTIAPFSLTLFIIFLIISLFFKTQKAKKIKINFNKKDATLFSIFLIIVILSLFKIIPLIFCFILSIFIFIFKKDALKVDYATLFTFVFFLLASKNFYLIFKNYHPNNIFNAVIVLSQFISNVPATLILHKFTNDYKPLLIGANIASFGTIVASLANILTYKIYLKYNKDGFRFFIKLQIYGILCNIVGILIYKIF